MWFKNLRCYRLSRRSEWQVETLEQQLMEHRFRPCGRLEAASYGWVPPLGRKGTQLVHAANGCLLLCARKEDKLLPSSVVRAEVNERVERIEDEELRDVSRKERERIRDEVVQDLLPRAFSRLTDVAAYVDPRRGWILIDAASASKAEELLSLLRQSVGSLPVKPLGVQGSGAEVMTGWLGGSVQARGFKVLDECELRAPGEDGGILRCRRQALDAEEIQTHLRAGKQAVRLAVEWDERLSCVLGEDLSIRRLRFSDAVKQEREDVAAEDDLARLDADFTFMTLELSRFLPALLSVFGGEARAVDDAA